MSLFDILFIAVALAMDAFTVAIAVGLHLSAAGGISKRQYFRLGFHFGLFQFLMPIMGWLAGSTISTYITAFDHWVVFILLAYIGIRMIREARRTEEYRRPDPTRGASLVLLSVATSIDALAMGISIAILDTAIFYPAIIIGIVAAAFTLIGMVLGRRLGIRWRASIACLGGIILIGIGIKVLLEHLLS